MRKLNVRGDTIIEVMLVLAVLSFSIGIAYATANRSLKATRAAHENSQATEILQTQMEMIRYLEKDSEQVPAVPVNTGIFQATYCINPTAATPVLTDIKIDLTLCKFDPVVDYTVTVTYSADDTFTLTATWPNVEGQGDDSMQMTFRLHKVKR